MGRPVPLNDLDRAIKAANRSRAALPDLYRRLCEGQLWALLPYHPEVEDSDLALQNGDAFPFITLRDDAGNYVPIFSSQARVDEALERAGIPRRTYSSAELEARQLLAIVGGRNLRASLNKSCAAGGILLPPDLLRDLASGEAFAVGSLERRESDAAVTWRIVPPDQYPTELVQTAYECLRRVPNYQAAWLFYQLATPDAPPAGPWSLMILMDPRDETVFHDLNLVMQPVGARHGGIHLHLVDENSTEERTVMFETGQPFYRWQPPVGTNAG